MAIRIASTAWTGTLETGKGDVALVSSGAAKFTVSFPRRIADEAEGVTSPEELIAAAHSACFAMQFSALLAEAGATPDYVDVTASVELAPDPAGGFHIVGITLEVRGYADNIDEDTFIRTAIKAKETCPVSKALAAVPSIEISIVFEAF